MLFGNTNWNQAPKCIRNTSPTPAGHELINTVVQVGAQGENKLNKLSRSLLFYRFGGLCPRPPLFLLLSFPHVGGRSRKIDHGAVESVDVALVTVQDLPSLPYWVFTVRDKSCDPLGNVILLYDDSSGETTYPRLISLHCFHLYKRFKLQTHALTYSIRLNVYTDQITFRRCYVSSWI